MITNTKIETETKPTKSLAFLKNLPLFNKWQDEDIQRFAQAAQLKNYSKGQVLYLEGETAEFFYIICTGWVKLFHTTEEGEEAILTIISKDSTTGEHAIFEHGCYTNSAQIVEEAHILILPLKLLHDELQSNNQLAFNMLSSMLQYQRRYELQLKQHVLYSAPQRIGCFLLGLCPEWEQKDGVRLDLPYDKSLIASTLGMKGATFSRALNILREETGITIIGTKIVIESMERLKNFVDGCYSSYPHM
ncbi:MAG: Crp/Fnr family transcriptional regulator [Alphaproteobacteria bacterium]